VYLGSQLEDVYEQILKGEVKGSKAAETMNIGVDTLPEIPMDPGDRNRTSPFAFTGNRFEFRAVGSGQSVAGPLVAMNTILAESLDWIAGELESELAKGTELNTAIHKILKEIMEKHGSVVFGGNGYSSEWHKMAVEERGLANLPTTADALPVLREKYIEELFDKTGVLSPVELESRFEVYAEQYLLSIEVEAKLVISMAKTTIYPAAMQYLSSLTSTMASLKDIGIEVDKTTVKKVSDLADSMMAQVYKLSDAMDKHDFETIEAHLHYYAKTIRSLMDEVRKYADALEAEIADELWPLPTYQEMLFIK
jgi:glutamine synthetase